MHEHRLIMRHNCAVSVTIPEVKNDPLSKLRRQLRAKQMQQRAQYSKGTMSANTARKLKSIAEAYLAAIYYKREAQSRAGVRITCVPTFITLTYPSVVLHSHEHCKRKHLGAFLSYLSRTKAVNAYIWRAELQQNQNIHFHIFGHRFTEWQWVRATWNNIIAADGYIDAFEKAHGHRNPNSTDIEMVRNLDKAGAYIAKYISKIDPSVSGQIKGRLYGMSDNVRAACKHYSISDADAHAFIHACYSAGISFEKKEINDFARLLFFEKSMRETLQKADMQEFKMYRAHYVNIANTLKM